MPVLPIVPALLLAALSFQPDSAIRAGGLPFPVLLDSQRQLARLAASAPTFARDVAPILYQHCAICHHPGEVAPFSLVTYQDAAKRAKLIATVTSTRYMP